MKTADESFPRIVLLPSLPEGTEARVRAIYGGQGMLARLADLGILPGVHLKVVRTARCGPVIVEVKGGRVIIGRGMADRIEVEPVPVGRSSTLTQPPDNP